MPVCSRFTCILKALYARLASLKIPAILLAVILALKFLAPPIVAHVLTQAQVLEARLLASGHRQFVAAGYRKTRDLAALNSGAHGVPEVDARNYMHVQQIEVSAGRITATMKQTGVMPALRGMTLTLTPEIGAEGIVDWHCTTDAAPEYRWGICAGVEE